MLAQRANGFLLSAVPWDVFCTLTVTRERGRESYGAAVDRWLRWVSESCNVDFHNNFFFVVRFERGEAGGRLHAHCLLRVPRFARGLFLVRPGRVCIAHRRWGLGLTRFRRVVRGDPAISYTIKGSEGLGGDEYERRKSDLAHDLVVSAALMNRARQKSTLRQPSCSQQELGGYTGRQSEGLRG